MSTIALSTVGAVVLTPFLMRLLVAGFPAPISNVNEYESLRQKYRWLELASQFAALAGMWVSVALVVEFDPGNTPWVLGIVLGWPVLAPVLLIAMSTIPRGVAHWSDFWRYYALRYRISLSFIAPVYIGLCVLGIISTLVLMFR